MSVYMHINTFIYTNVLAKLACSFEICAELESFPNAALRVVRKGSLDVFHLDSSWSVLTFPEQSVNKHLERKVGILH